MAKRKTKRTSKTFEERLADANRRVKELELKKQLADLRGNKKS